MTSRMQIMINGAQTAINYTFLDPTLLWEALQAAGSGVHRIGTRGVPDGNKSLALVGDAALKLVLVMEGYENDATRVAVGNALASVGSNANLAFVGRQHSLEAYVNNNPAQGATVSAGTIATTVEAILGAVYLDSGMNIGEVTSVMQALGLSWPGN